MRISAISNNELKICLTESEAVLLFGGSDKINCDNPQVRKILGFLIGNEEIEKRFLMSNGEFSTEVKLNEGGCTITFKKMPTAKPKALNKKIGEKHLLLCFKDSNSLLSCLKFLKNTNLKICQTALYSYETNYFLILVLKEYKKHYRFIFSEYCQQITLDKIALSYIEEHGKLISGDITKLLFL